MKPIGSRVANGRKMLNEINLRLRTGFPWDRFPSRFGPKSTVHDWV